MSDEQASRPAASSDPSNSSRPDSEGFGDDVAAQADRLRRRQGSRFGCMFWFGAASCVATAVVLFCVCVVWRDGAVADAALDRARAAGDPVTVGEMEAYYPTSPAIEEATAHWRKTLEIYLRESSPSDVPIVDRTWTPDERGFLRPDDLADAKSFLDRYREAIESAHAARRAGAVARFPLKFQQGFRAPNIEAITLRRFMNALRLECEAKLAEGDLAAATETILTMVAASESLSNEPVAGSQSIRVTNLRVAVEQACRSIARAEFSDEQLSRMQAAFARQDFAAGIGHAQRGEQFNLIRAMESGESAPKGAVRFRDVPLRGGDVAYCLDLRRSVIAASDEGVAEALVASAAAEAELDRLSQSSLSQLSIALTFLTAGGIDGQISGFASGQVDADAGAAVVACERYRQARGEWPTRLADLVPEYLDAVPTDPFDGRPLRYVVDADGLLIYSVSYDRVDDGGAIQDSKGRDIGLRVPNFESGADR